MSDRTFQRACLYLALAGWLLYAATSDGTMSVDPYTRWQVAESIAEHGSVALPYGARHTVRHDDRDYSVFFPGQSILFLPAAGAGVLAARILPVDPSLASMVAQFFVCVFVISSFAPLAFLGHVAVLRALNVRPKIALTSGVVLLVGTPLWVWASNGSEETALATLSIWAAWALIDAARIARRAAAIADPTPTAAADFTNRLGIAGALLAIGLTHRSTFMTVVLGMAVLGLPLLVANRRLIARAPRRFALWLLLGAAIVSIVPFYNWLRFDDAFDTGYREYYQQIGGLFSTPLLTGLRGHLLSPGKSVFLYVPWLVLLPFAFIPRGVRRRLGILAPALLVAFAAHLVIYSLHTYWSGAFGWGVRFHVSLLPLLLVPIGVWLDEIRMTRPRRALVIALAVVSTVVQLAGNALSYGLEYRQHREDYTGYRNLIPVEAAWTWKGSQLRLRFINIVKKLDGEPLLDITEDDNRQITTVWSIFPLRAGVALDRPAIVAGLWGLWVALLVLAATAAACAARQWRRLDAAPRPPGA